MHCCYGDLGWALLPVDKVHCFLQLKKERIFRHFLPIKILYSIRLSILSPVSPCVTCLLCSPCSLCYLVFPVSSVFPCVACVPLFPLCSFCLLVFPMSTVSPLSLVSLVSSFPFNKHEIFGGVALFFIWCKNLDGFIAFI